MKTESEQNDSLEKDSLKKLLDMKRREAPPAHFFDGFSERILTEIQATPIQPPKNRWQRFWEAFQGRPLLAAFYTLAICGITVGGILIVWNWNSLFSNEMPQPVRQDLLIRPEISSQAGDSSATTSAIQSNLPPGMVEPPPFNPSNLQYRIKASQTLRENSATN